MAAFEKFNFKTLDEIRGKVGELGVKVSFSPNLPATGQNWCRDRAVTAVYRWKVVTANRTVVRLSW